MSLAINVDKVIAVLLADGWHSVGKFKDGRSSFDIDSYEYIQHHPDPKRESICLHRGGNCGICAAGAAWDDEDTGERMVCPLTSVLAVKGSL